MPRVIPRPNRRKPGRSLFRKQTTNARKRIGGMSLTNYLVMKNHRGSDIIQRAEAWWKADGYSGSGEWLDQSGNGHNAAFPGGGADPKFLAYAGVQHMFLPGVTGNTATATSSTNLNTAAVMVTMVTYAALDDWNIANVTFGGYLNDCYLQVRTNNTLRVNFRSIANGNTFAASTVGGPFVDGQGIWIKCEIDIAASTVDFFTSTDAVGTALSSISWSVLGATDVAFSATITDPVSETSLILGATSNGMDLITGDLYRFNINIDGTEEFDANFTDQPTAPFTTFTEGSSNADTVTINRVDGNYKTAIVDRPLFMFDGVDDYLSVPDHANLNFTGGDGTIIAVFRLYITEQLYVVIAKKLSSDTADAGWSLHHHSFPHSHIGISDGVDATTNHTLTVPAIGVIASHAGVIDKTGANDLVVYMDGVSEDPPDDITDIGDLTNSVAVTIGAIGEIGDFFEGEYLGAAIFREALTPTEILLASTRLGG